MGICASDITITSLETINAFDISTGDHLWTLDELQNATISNTEETTDITGKQGRRLNTIKLNKSATISGTNGLISAGLLATQTGSTPDTAVTDIMWPEFVTVESNKANISYVAVGDVGDEIGAVYVCTGNNTLGTKFTQASAVATGKFTYTPETKLLTFYSGDIDDGTEIAVYYHRHISAQVVENSTDHYAKKVTLYVDAFGEDVCNNIYHIQFYIPRADFSGNFDVAMGDTQAVHAFEATILAGGRCEAGTNKGLLWNYKIFGENAEDVVEGD